MTRRLPLWIALALLLRGVVELGAVSVVFSESFTTSANQDVTAAAPDTGSGWTEVTDTSAGLALQRIGATDFGALTGTATNNSTVLYRAAPNTGIAGQNYDLALDYEVAAGGTDDPIILVFGWDGSDANDWCGVAIYEAGASPDVAVFKLVAGTPTDLTSGTVNTDPVAGTDIFLLEARGNSYTVKKNGSAILSGLSDTACDNDNEFGLAFGAYRVGTDDPSTGYRFDNFVVTDQTTGAAPPTLMLGGVGAWLDSLRR